MAFAHNAMLRGLNAIYLQAPHVPAKDAPDFLFFVASWSAWVIHHHGMEENTMFPLFESVHGVQSLQHNVDQHHAFSAGLTTLREYATATTSDTYSGPKIREIIDSFAEAFRTHLVDEIDTLWAMDSVPAGTPESAKLLSIYQDCEAEAGKQDKSVVPPMVLGLCDRTFQGGNSWPKMPTGSAWIVHYVFGRKHRGAWKFLPCDTFRNPRPLRFLGEGGEGGQL
jgi:hemerythrin-like domain-containing protein